MVNFWELATIGFATGLGSALGTYIVNNYFGKKLDRYFKKLKDKLNKIEEERNGSRF